MLAATANMQQQQIANSADSAQDAESRVTAIKLERRDSTTSESSVEHLDLGCTPKKLGGSSHKAATSTPHATAPLPQQPQTQTNGGDHQPAQQQPKKSRLHDSDEANDYDEEEDEEEEEEGAGDVTAAKAKTAADASISTPSSAAAQSGSSVSGGGSRQRHYKRRGSRLDKRTSVQLEYNADNPNSLRKKFRFNRSAASNGDSVSFGTATNESGFVDASSTSSQFLNASAAAAGVAAAPHSSSSASSSPHGSSPESGVERGERDTDAKYVKYVCPICEVMSANAHEFTNHIRCHNYASGDTENFTCRICKKVLSSASSLDRHVLVHTGERPFNCKYCHLTFTTNGNMHRHMRTHKQHPHNHHRRNSNGTKNQQSAAASAAAAVAAAAAAAAAAATSVAASVASPLGLVSTAQQHAQLSNGGAAEGAKAAAASANGGGKLSGRRNNGSSNNNNANNGNGKGESYESDGGCSTDSSSLNSHGSNLNNNNNSSNHNNNNNNKMSNNNNSYKRKNSDAELATGASVTAATLSADDIAHQLMMKRRVKTTINNNNIIAASDENGAENNNTITKSDEASLRPAEMAFSCPVCPAAEPFESNAALSQHLDSEHPDIPAKCRHCDVIFRTHRQLNLHQCAVNLKDFPFPLHEFAAEKFPHLSKTLYERSRKALEAGDSSGEDEEVRDEDLRREQQRQEDFFRNLYLKNKALQQQQVSGSPHHSADGTIDGIKYELDEHEKLMGGSHQSHDSKDLADIQSILNMTSSSSTSQLLRNFEHAVNTPSSNYSLDKDEEEAQDAFTSEFRKMKLRGEFPCKLCTAVYPNLRALKGHNRIHLSAAGPSGPFRCNMCPYAINDKATLIRHMRTHNGDRPYECAVCNYAFTTKANCERHLRNRHVMRTRDEVKSAIIYHPSEDSSCDDPAKKLSMFGSGDLDDDIDLLYPAQPKDRSTPVSHLKEILTSENGAGGSLLKPMKIQVKSLEQLLDKSTASSTYSETFEEPSEAAAPTPASGAPIDLSMDVLDLSKKPTGPVLGTPKDLETPKESVVRPSTPPLTPKTIDPLANVTVEMDKGHQDQQQQLFLAQQQMMDPAQYFQQYLRNLMLQPSLNPFFLQNAAFMSNNLNEFQKLAPFMSQMFAAGGPNMVPPPTSLDMNLKVQTGPGGPPTMLPQVSPLMSDKSSPAPSVGQLLSKSLSSQNLGRHSNSGTTLLPGGPVKMVIKNGVLMPKQKQRRYRTERPFACEHCSARFTLRSNMERHVKQQHPQYYAQRQRSGHSMRGRGASSSSAMNSISHLQAAFAQAHNGGASGNSPISEQVKYAILAQQLKARKDTDLLQQALAHGSSNVAPSHHMIFGADANGAASPVPPQFGFAHLGGGSSQNGLMAEDDEPKLVIDEDEEDEDIEEIADDEDMPEIKEEEEDAEEGDIPQPVEEVRPKEREEPLEEAKKVAESILEQAIKSQKPEAPAEEPVSTVDSMKSMIAQAESVAKSLKEVASSPFKDESPDLVPVAKLVDNATSNSVSFNNYFRRSDVANHMEQSDEEGLVASGSASESNNSGAEDVATSVEPKKKSAYSLAPNRVSCPYCQRMFPWSSSLRRHILTHTGQKPFKCSHCPLLFTTKSNCDRHLLRKHGNVESAVSVYVPTEDVSEPIPVPKSVEEIEQQQRQREEEERERKRKAEAEAEAEAKKERLALEAKRRRERELQEEQHQLQMRLLKQLQEAQEQLSQGGSPKAALADGSGSADFPFKCHLCENSFGERSQCLDHIKAQHAQEFALLMAKGAIDSEATPEGPASALDEEEGRRCSEEGGSGRGKYPDYSNRKVICAFCVRRFWSTEDLRRHMRTHSGERPFQCEICLRKFTLKHSMLRHMKKHNGQHHNGGLAGENGGGANSGSDFSDDEQMPMPMPRPSVAAANGLDTLSSMRVQKIQDLLFKANEWRLKSSLGEHKENIVEEHGSHTDLIANLLGISDQGILNKVLACPDEAAKLLGVDK